MKKRIVTITIFVLFLLAAPITLIVMGFATPAQFEETYYGELSAMYRRLREAQGKRIIVIGGSSVAFGLRGDLMEREFTEYTVCPFGLYGSIGTKFMMDLARSEIGEGDIVLLAPEQSEQSLSLYFGAEHIWKAADGDFSILAKTDFGDTASLVGAYPAFVAQKYGYLKEGAPVPTDVYARASFNEECTLVYDRPYNIMAGGTDSFSISYDCGVASESFLSYVNEFSRTVKKKGGSLLFGFCPANLSGLSEGTTEETIEEYRAYLAKKLDCEVMGTPLDYIYEREWFYDTNVHCNSAGAILYTRQLVKDLKGCLGDPGAIQTELPQKPELPSVQETEGDDSDADAFLYEPDGEGLRIVGMTQSGLSLERVTVPVHAEGKLVTGFSEETFRGNAVLTEIRLQSNIKRIEGGSFSGCAALTRLYMAKGNAPGNCVVLSGLLEGAPKLKIYVERALLSQYATNYFWSKYAAALVAY